MIASVRALLSGVIDYAGLFPPAALSMSDAVSRYAAYHGGPHAWMLGRFVVPAPRIAEFARVADSITPGPGVLWRLSVLLGSDAPADIAAIAAFNAAHRGFVCDAAETRAPTLDALAIIVTAVRDAPLATFVEIPPHAEVAALVQWLGDHGLRAKIRMGGVTPDAFPTPAEVIRFLGACVRAKLPFKATAGLHHSLRGAYPLTYDEQSPRGPMFGFLNVLLAAALLRDGGSDTDATALLTETDPSALTFADDGVRWRGCTLLTVRLAQLREQAVVSLGSCSFTEPVDELLALRVL
jgi:hypothetical protein